MSGSRRPPWHLVLGLCCALVGLVVLVETSRAQIPKEDEPTPLAPLSSVSVPESPDLSDFVQDTNAARQLGKALFWDMQVGSDGVQACASCHFHAGADNRAKNQLSPGLLGNDTTFQSGGPNATLTTASFPFHKLKDLDDQGSKVLFDSNDVASSQGVFNRNFVDIVPSSAADRCDRVADPVFSVGGINTRRVEPRNTPSVNNAVFNFRNFWDGRANNDFNGVNASGARDPDARVWKVVNNQLQQVSVRIPLSSLASQAVAPPRSVFEMSCENRVFPKIGRKLLQSGLIPLGKQTVDRSDSVLGPLARGSATGLQTSYSKLVQQAFKAEYWNSSTNVTLGSGQFTGELEHDLIKLLDRKIVPVRAPKVTGLASDQYSQMEANFSLFFGLAVQIYEAGLISDQTPVDRFLAGSTGALNQQQKNGLVIFQDQGRCIECHGGAELTAASVSSILEGRLERMRMVDNGCAVYDQGFFNNGVRPTADDLGVGGQDPFGNPLSDTRMAMAGQLSDTGLEPPLGEVRQCDRRANVDGAFKTPGLRNVELTGPYFHNGGMATLMQVVDFYNRGGNFAQQNVDNLDPNIQALGLTETQKQELVAFLVGLTDERVRFQKAPFDHPSLCVPNGHPGGSSSVQQDGSTGQATDDLLCIPAVGATGSGTPLTPFLNLNPAQH